MSCSFFMNLCIRIGKKVSPGLPQLPFMESGFGRIAGIAMFLAIALLAGIRFYRLRYFGEFVDESDGLVVGWLLSQGHTLYGSVFSHHTPLVYMTTHIVAVLSPSDDFAHFRIIPWVFLVLSGLSFLISPLKIPVLLKALTGALFMLLVAILAPIWAGHMVLTDSLWGYLFICFCNVFLLPAALGHLVPSRKSKVLLVLGGVALVGWVSGSLITAYPSLILLLWSLFLLKIKGKDCFQSLRWLCAGIALGVVALVTWLLSFGDIVGFFEQAILFNIKVYSQFSEFPGEASLLSILRHQLHRIFLTNTYVDNISLIFLLLGVSCLGCYAYFYEHWSIRRSGLLAVCVLALLLSLRARSNVYHAFHAAPFYLGVLGIFAWSVGVVASTGKANAVMLVLALVSLLTYYSIQKADQYIPFSWNEADHGKVIGELEPTVQYIIENTAQSDKIAAFVAHPILYLKTKRQPAHSGIFYYPWNAKWEESRGGMTTCSEIKHAMPKFIWLDRRKVWGRYEFGEFAKCLEEFISVSYYYVDQARFPYLLHRTTSVR